MTTAADILREVKSATIIATGANLTVPNDIPKGSKPSDFVRGWAQIQVAGKPVKFSAILTEKTIRRRILTTIDPALDLNASRPKILRQAFGILIQDIKDAAHAAAIARVQNESKQILEKVQVLVAGREARMKRQNYRNACTEIEKLFQGPLFDMAEEELLEIFRTNRIKHVMES